MTSKHTYLMYTFIGFALCWILWRGVRLGWNDTATDFNNYYASAKLFRQGKSIHSFYANEEFSELAQAIDIENGAKFSPFSPPTALLYWPLSFFELITAKRIWLVVNVLILFVLPFRFRYYFHETNYMKNVFVISLFFVPIASNLHFGQFYLAATFVLLEATGFLLSKQKALLTGLLLGGLTVIKYFPILFLGYALKSSKMAVKTILAALLIMVAITLIFIWIDPMAYGVYLNDFGEHMNGNLSGQGKFAIGFQSIDALLNNLFVFNAVENPQPIIDLTILKSVCKWFFLGAMVFCCRIMLRAERFVYSRETVSICIVGAFTILPASASYHFLLLIVPVLFIDYWLNEKRMNQQRIIVWLLLITTFFVQAHHIPSIKGWPFVDLLLHFPRFWLLLTLFSYLFYSKRIVQING